MADQTQFTKKMIGEVFLEVADALETGKYGEKIKIGLTTMGSEHGVQNLVAGAEQISKSDSSFDVVLIGPKVDSKLEQIEVTCEKDMYAKMEELLDSGYIGGCVTMHYTFPMGVSTVGRVITPAMGGEMLLATTTGTTDSKRVPAMVKNAINGIITAKALGIESPSVGILNLDGARQVEMALNDLIKNGYKISFSESVRSDGGAVMRGNDLLCGNVDVMITDTLTGNIMMKVFSSYTTGGSYEAAGYGYGPGIGDGYNRLILILSRASGVPVVANALKYAAELARGKVLEISKAEYAKAKKAGLNDILASFTKGSEQKTDEVVAPEKEVVTEEISGVDIMSLEDAVICLWKHKVYAESGMGCTGPIVLVNPKNAEKAREILVEAKFL